MAGRKYGAYGDGTALFSPGRTLLAIVGPSNSPGRLYQFAITSDQTPADAAYRIKLMRAGNAGTATILTARPLDSGLPAANYTPLSNHTVEPTYTSNSELVDIAMPQRGVFRWKAKKGGELVIPHTPGNPSIGFRVIHPSTAGAFIISAFWEE